MTRKTRRLYSVPTGADVDATSNSAVPTGYRAPTAPRALVGLDGDTGPTSIPGWPFPLVDLSSLTPDGVANLMDRIGRFSQDGRFQAGQQQAATPSRRRPRRNDPATLRVRVDLDGISPPVWRRVDLDSMLSLDQLHRVLQSLFGWLDLHLHSFLRGDSRHDRTAERYLSPFDVAEGDDGVLESEVRLDELFVEPGDKLFYTYDFGDSWEHTLVLESVLDRAVGDSAARCIAGRREGPPEDCGGIWGYQELQERGALEDDPEVFDLAEINEHLDDLGLAGSMTRRSVDAEPARSVTATGAAGLPAPLSDLLGRTFGPLGSTLPDLLSRIDLSTSIALPAAAAAGLAHRYSWLLDRVGRSGLPLTAAGYLKPVDVSAAFSELGLDNEWIGSGNREANCPPVLTLRKSSQKLGLLRSLNGRLLLTRAGSSLANDPSGLLDWIASRLPVGNSAQEQDAGRSLLIVIAALGPPDTAGARQPIDHLLAEVLTGLGWRDDNGRPIGAISAIVTAEPTEMVLLHLGVLQWLPRSAGRTVTPEGAEFARLALTR